MPDKTAKLVRAYPPAVYGNAGTTISLLYKSDANYAVLATVSLIVESSSLDAV